VVRAPIFDYIPPEHVGYYITDTCVARRQVLHLLTACLPVAGMRTTRRTSTVCFSSTTARRTLTWSCRTSCLAEEQNQSKLLFDKSVGFCHISKKNII
jgi:hypothetical protein